MSVKDGKLWVYGPDEEDFTSNAYATEEEALAAMKNDPEIVPGGEFFLGKLEHAPPPVLNGREFAAGIGEAAVEEYGEDEVGDWLDEDMLDSHEAAVDDLGRRLTEVFHTWLREQNLMPEIEVVDIVRKGTKPL